MVAAGSGWCLTRKNESSILSSSRTVVPKFCSKVLQELCVIPLFVRNLSHTSHTKFLSSKCRTPYHLKKQLLLDHIAPCQLDESSSCHGLVLNFPNRIVSTSSQRGCCYVCFSNILFCGEKVHQNGTERKATGARFFTWQMNSTCSLNARSLGEYNWFHFSPARIG